MLFNGKSVVVTGAGRGIGREIALAFASNGARVIVNDLGVSSNGSGQNPEIARAVVEEIRARNGTAISHTGSVSDFDTTRDIIGTCVNNFGGIDVLVNAAGFGSRAPIWEATEKSFDDLTAVHLKGTFNLCRHACYFMKEQRSGCIINFTSDFWRGIHGFTGLSIYSAVKAGVVGLTRAIAREMEEYGATCNAIAPLAHTRMLIREIHNSAKEAYYKGKIEHWLYDELSGPGGPENIPPVVLFLASPHGAKITGKVIGASKGRVAIYAEPDEQRRLQKTGAWKVEELINILPGFFR